MPQTMIPQNPRIQKVGRSLDTTAVLVSRYAKVIREVENEIHKVLQRGGWVAPHERQKLSQIMANLDHISSSESLRDDLERTKWLLYSLEDAFRDHTTQLGTVAKELGGMVGWASHCVEIIEKAEIDIEGAIREWPGVFLNRELENRLNQIKERLAKTSENKPFQSDLAAAKATLASLGSLDEKASLPAPAIPDNTGGPMSQMTPRQFMENLIQLVEQRNSLGDKETLDMLEDFVTNNHDRVAEMRVSEQAWELLGELSRKTADGEPVDADDPDSEEFDMSSDDAVESINYAIGMAKMIVQQREQEMDGYILPEIMELPGLYDDSDSIFLWIPDHLRSKTAEEVSELIKQILQHKCQAQHPDDWNFSDDALPELEKLGFQEYRMVDGPCWEIEYNDAPGMDPR